MISLYVTEVLDATLTAQHQIEIRRYLYNHQVSHQEKLLNLVVVKEPIVLFVKDLMKKKNLTCIRNNV